MRRKMGTRKKASALEFYNPDKGRRTLNLTEKYKKSAGSKENKKSKTSGKRAQK